MAIVWGNESTHNGMSGKIGLKVVASDLGDTYKVWIEIYYWSKWKLSDSSNEFKFGWGYTPNISLGGFILNAPSNVAWSDQNMFYLGADCDQVQTFTKKSYAQTIEISANFRNIEYGGGSGSVYTTFTVPALSTHTVYFDANGGYNAPSYKIRNRGENITLPSTRPYRDGYSFDYWVSAYNKAVYHPGSSYPGAYTIEQDDTLKASWTASSYSIVYYGNGSNVSGVPYDQTKNYNQSITLSNKTPTRTGYNFLGWSEDPGATYPTYSPGENYSYNSNLYLYAVWESNYVRPTLSNLSARKCDVNGKLDDNGTYIKVSFSWSSEYAVHDIKVGYKKNNTSEAFSYTTVIRSQPTQNYSGNESIIIGNGAISPSMAYIVDVKISDKRDTTDYTNKTIAVTGVIYTVDFLKGGKGVAFGKEASKQNSVEIAADWDLNVYGQSLQALIDASVKNYVDNNIKEQFPIGSIYLSVNDTNPSNYFGGKWVRWGKGRVPVGVDEGYYNFNSAEKIGGEAWVTLKESELPVISGQFQSRLVEGYNILDTYNNGGCFSSNFSGGERWGSQIAGVKDATGNNTLISMNFGGGESHNNLQPYITCYMWKRTQ